MWRGKRRPESALADRKPLPILTNNAVCRLVNGQAFWNGGGAALPQVSRSDYFRMRRHTVTICWRAGGWAEADSFWSDASL
jgi:hypothetical protein